MALGALDARGIWIHGEDDSYATWTEWLNKGQTSTSTQFAADRTRLTALEANTWIAPTLTSSWINFGSGFRPAGYRKRGTAIRLRGSIKSGLTGISNPIMTLPTGHRPAAIEQFLVIANAGYADLRIETNGVVYIAAFAGSGNNGIVSLAGIEFEAA